MPCLDYSYFEKFFKSLKSEFNEGNYWDIIIQSNDGKSLKAHKVVLASASSYFKSMFESHLIEVQTNLIKIQNFNWQTLNKVLEYIYSGEIILEEENAIEVFTASHMFQVGDLEGLCVKFIIENLDSSNGLGIYFFSKQFTNTKLTEDSRHFISSHFIEISKSQEFLDLSLENLVEYLMQDGLIVENETELFKSCMKWVFHDSERRSEHVEEVLRTLRIPMVSLDYLHHFNSSCGDQKVKKHLIQILEDFEFSKKNSNFKNSLRLMEVCSINRISKGTRALLIGGMEEILWQDPITFDSSYTFNFQKQLFTQDFSPSLSEPRAGHCGALVGGKVFLFGGEENMVMSQKVEEWEVGTRSFREVTLMSPCRVHASCCQVANLVYIFGGQDDQRTCLRRIEIFNTWTDSFLPPLSLPLDVPPTFGHSVLFHKGLIYILGGKFEKVTSACFTFNPTTETFDPIKGMRKPRCFFGAVSSEDHIFVVGGNTGKGVTSSVERYSTLEDKWEELEPLSQPRAHHVATIFEDEIFVFGGKNDEGEMAGSLEKLNLKNFTPNPHWKEVDGVTWKGLDFCLVNI